MTNILMNPQLSNELSTELRALQEKDQQTINTIWKLFEQTEEKQKTLLLKGILTQCCFPQLSQVSTMLEEMIRIDFVTVLPPEIGYKILKYLDSKSLCRAAQVCKKWNQMADNDAVWRRLCEQHIEKKCTKCGWGLPLLIKRPRSASPPPSSSSKSSSASTTTQASYSSSASSSTSEQNTSPASDHCHPPASKKRKTIPWKSVYSERYTVESNWRNGRFKTRLFQHTAPITTLHLLHPYLVTGTQNGIIHVWDVQTGKLMRQLNDHRGAVSALKMDAHKLVSGSYDETIRVWNYHTGACLATFRGGQVGKITCLDFEGSTVVSGSTDALVKVWNFADKTCFSLRGHTAGVNSVKVECGKVYSGSEDGEIRIWDIASKLCVKIIRGVHVNSVTGVSIASSGVLVSGSKDNTVRIWDLNKSDEEEENKITPITDSSAAESSSSSAPSIATLSTPKRTLFGHLKGVNTVSADKFRIASGAGDNQVKVWDLESGKVLHTFGLHQKVTSVELSDTSVVAGSEDGMVKMWDFASC